jgi:surfeit locus 1 family protein
MPEKPSNHKLKSRLNLVLAGLFFVGTAAGLVGLGYWQLKRAGWKEGLIAQSQLFMALPTQPFTPGAAYHEWQRIIAEGQFDTSREVVLESQLGPTHTPGYRIVTPLVIGKHEVLVDRGWINRDFSPDFLRRYAPQHNQFTAVVRAFPQRHGWLLGPTESYGAAKTLVFFDPAAVPTKPGVERLNYYLQASSQTHEDVAAFITTPAQSVTPARHREYAFTWFACASLWLACGVYYAFIALRVPAPSVPMASNRKAPKSSNRQGKPRR